MADEFQQYATAPSPPGDEFSQYAVQQPPADEATDEGHPRTRALARGAIESVAALPVLVTDALTAAGNLGGHAAHMVSRGLGLEAEGEEAAHDPDMSMPHVGDQQLLDKFIKPTKSHGGLELATSLLLPTPGEIGRLGSLAAKELPKLGKIPVLDIIRSHIGGQPLTEEEKILQKGNGLGYKFLPSDLPHAPIGTAAQGVSGSARMADEVSLSNGKRVQEVIQNEFHLPPGSELTEPRFRELEQPAFEKYEQLRGMGEFNHSNPYFIDVANSGHRGSTELEKYYPEAIPEEVGVERSKWARPQSSGSAALDAMKQLRAEGKVLARARDDPGKLMLSAVKLDIAKAMEKELDYVAQEKAKIGKAFHLEGAPAADAMKQFQNARKYLAKLWAIEDATVEGWTSPRALGEMYRKGAQFEGDLKTTAQAVLRHPNAFRAVKGRAHDVLWTVHDGAMMGIGLLSGKENFFGHSEWGYGLAAMAMARPAVRKFLQSRFAQKVMTRPGQRITTRAAADRVPRAAALTAETMDLGDQGP
jgi:hypothetical protein